MANIPSVVICIQARSNSTRLPGKVNETVCGRTILEKVVDSCEETARYLNKSRRGLAVMVKVIVAVPYNDPIKQKYKGKAHFVEGPEDDVLSRYKIVADRFQADYIVRITSDCVLTRSTIVTKHINCAVENSLDYVSNVFQDLRTFPEGMDCEVISKRLLDWLNTSATTPDDREHVTSLISKSPPEWASFGHVLFHMDLSHHKTSVDTLEDLERARAMENAIMQKKEKAAKLHGRKSIFRF